MADMTVETGSASSTANSYCSLDNADTYHEKRLHKSDWTSASDDNKEIALMWATRLLDEQVDWYGSKHTTSQALRWPRSGVLMIDGDEFITSTEIPEWLYEATAEYARHLIIQDRQHDPDTAGFKRIKAGSLDITIDKRDRIGHMPASVWSMIKPYGTRLKNPLRRLEKA